MIRKIKIKQLRSTAHKKPKQKATLRALGLRKVNSEREHEETPVIRGMIDVVKHLVEVTEIK